MELSVFVEIKKPIEDVWKAIIDFKNCSNYIESIVKLEIIDEPKDTLIGFKWKETRVMFGKEAVETMWITDYAENEYYQTRAESHGSIYKSRISIEHVGENTKLTMSFTAEAQTFFVKVFSKCMGFMIKGSMKKALIKDLNDIKTHLESK
ncbi:SRPBCC family protein [uncultured Winogradskyella sp.]|uniref:SRPBCC family protein n=1 Tax=uncultured Winogradskyella sp. TaxID=395353 RepID=UPI0030D6DAD4|tara:strand:- start:19537 stop:19986 length:450 start_codon:yes stop_codon:yes gene_type:complete